MRPKEVVNRILIANPGLIYRYSYINEVDGIRYVFRDIDFGHYEINVQGLILIYQP